MKTKKKSIKMTISLGIKAYNVTGIATTLTYGKYLITFYTCPYTEDFSVIVRLGL